MKQIVLSGQSANIKINDVNVYCTMEKKTEDTLHYCL